MSFQNLVELPFRLGILPAQPKKDSKASAQLRIIRVFCQSL